MADYLWYPHDDNQGFYALERLAPAFGALPQTYQSPAYGEIFCHNAGNLTCPAGLWDVTNNDSVYIIGHSSSGLKVLGDAVGKLMNQSELVERLGKCGLAKHVSPTIVVYACYSGRGEGCLAEMIATRLDQTGYGCSRNVYGFTKKVSDKGRATTGLTANFGTKTEPNWVPIADVTDTVRVNWQPKVYN